MLTITISKKRIIIFSSIWPRATRTDPNAGLGLLLDFTNKKYKKETRWYKDSIFVILSIPVLTPVLKRFLTRHIPSPGNAYSKKRNSNLRNPCGFMMMRKLDVIILNCESLFMLPSQIMSNRISDLKKILTTCMIIPRMRFYLTCKIMPTLWKFWNE